MLVTLLGAVASAHADPLAIDGLRPAYSGVSEVRSWLRNTGQVRVWLDSFNLDRIDVERQVEESGDWIVGSGFRCANAGAGSPQSLPPGGSIEVRIGSIDAFDLPERFQPDRGNKVYPLPGRYRIRASYSVERWATVAEIPQVIDTVVSAVFEVKSGGT